MTPPPAGYWVRNWLWWLWISEAALLWLEEFDVEVDACCCCWACCCVHDSLKVYGPEMTREKRYNLRWDLWDGRVCWRRRRGRESCLRRMTLYERDVWIMVQGRSTDSDEWKKWNFTGKLSHSDCGFGDPELLTSWRMSAKMGELEDSRFLSRDMAVHEVEHMAVS